MSRKWAVILGVSSGFGAAAAEALAAEGFGIVGLHLDRRSTRHLAEGVAERCLSHGVPVHFFNDNAVDDGVRAKVLETLADVMAEGEQVDVFMHSLAFGSLEPYVRPPGEEGRTATRKQVEMTSHVMAHSLVYWVQDLVQAGLIGKGSRILAMASSGDHLAFPSYGPVSAAKAALNAHIRQLAMELAPYGATANAIQAGVTKTPALDKIPGSDRLVEKAYGRNPHGRLTEPEDVAACIVALTHPGTYWLNGNVLQVDGGEDACG